MFYYRQDVESDVVCFDNVIDLSYTGRKEMCGLGDEETQSIILFSAVTNWLHLGLKYLFKNVLLAIIY